MVQLKQKSVVLGTFDQRISAALASYEQWLFALNYSSSARRKYPAYLRSFFDWSGIGTIDQINDQAIQAWFTYLSHRPHKRQAGGLSLHTLKDHLRALKQFNRYLREQGVIGFDVSVKLREREESQKVVLSVEEIYSLYAATDHVTDPGLEDKGLLASRERVLLGLYYGCGLRKSEGLALKTKDVLLTKGLLFVRAGKCYQERYVPIPGRVLLDLQAYMSTSRKVLVGNERHDYLLVGWQGKRLQGTTLGNRLRLLVELAGIDKVVVLHTLRHSIATHLLASKGMKLDQIAQFLGHRSLSSTQLYTHITDG